MDFDAHSDCLNCGEPLATPFCGNCGQRKAVRLTLKELFKVLQRGVLEFRSPLIYTLKMLTINPGRVCYEYVHGKRERYFNPENMLFGY